MSYTIILPTAYGNMLVNRYDGNQTQYLLQTGKAIDAQEMESVQQFIEPGTNAVDIGTCFGCWTLAFSKRAAKVYSFEAQRMIYNQLCGSLALNSIDNVHAYNVAVGAKPDVLSVPKYNYGAPLEFGCVYFCPKTAHGDLTQEPLPSTETVNVVTLDSYNLSNVSLIKIDVEGMEADVLAGAQETIKNNRPVMHLEIFMDRAGLLNTLENLGYLYVVNEMNAIAWPAEKFTVAPLKDGVQEIKRKQVREK